MDHVLKKDDPHTFVLNDFKKMLPNINKEVVDALVALKTKIPDDLVQTLVQTEDMLSPKSKRKFLESLKPLGQPYLTRVNPMEVHQWWDKVNDSWLRDGRLDLLLELSNQVNFDVVSQKFETMLSLFVEKALNHFPNQYEEIHKSVMFKRQQTALVFQKFLELNPKVMKNKYTVDVIVPWIMNQLE